MPFCGQGKAARRWIKVDSTSKTKPLKKQRSKPQVPEVYGSVLPPGLKGSRDIADLPTKSLDSSTCYYSTPPCSYVSLPLAPWQPLYRYYVIPSGYLGLEDINNKLKAVRLSKQ